MRGPILLAVAHPDDESMFFTPMLLHLMRRQIEVYVLCLSTGKSTLLLPCIRSMDMSPAWL
jgi:LmbE family N-acetylglucosaminyl deacetylase